MISEEVDDKWNMCKADVFFSVILIIVCPRHLGNINNDRKINSLEGRKETNK